MSISTAVRTLRLGTRRSALARAQSGQIAVRMEATHPGLKVELVTFETAGDLHQGALWEKGGKGLFTQELEAGLLDGSLDFAVHSLKDLPVVIAAGTEIAAYPLREDPRDVLVSEVATSVDDLPQGAVVLTGSLRRRAQLLSLRPDLRVEAIRGNIDTRVRKWREQNAGGVILAAAGLHRLGLEAPAHPLDPVRFLPAPGQGILALQARSGSEAARLCAALDHLPSRRAAEAERAVVARFGGDCTLPLAAHAGELDGGGMRMAALLALPDGSRAARGEAIGPDPASVAAACGEALERDGAAEILAAIRSTLPV